MPLVICRLREEYPGCEIRLTEEVPGQKPNLDGVDLLFFDGRLEGDVEHLKLFDDPYVLVTRPGNFPDGPVRVEQLDDAPLVAYPLICDQPRMEQALGRSGATPRVVFRSAGDDTLLSMVRAGVGAAVLPSLAARAATVAGDGRLRIHELQPALPPREIYLIWGAGRTHSPHAARTIQIALGAASELTATP